MELTGKCKADFEKSKLANNYNLFNTMLPIYQNALIIEFFDSVGIYIHLKRNCFFSEYRHWFFIITDVNGCHLNNFLEVKIENNSRQEAQIEAIKKANEIYNDKY